MKAFQGLFLALFFVAVFALPAPTEAASLYIDPPFSELNRGDAVELSIRLDTDENVGECINAVDAVITYSESIVPVDISLGNSIFSMWVEEPVVNTEQKTITFAGGIPNGYCGRVQGDPRLTNTLVTMIFRSPGFSIGGGASNDNTTATVDFEDFTTAYLNDGLGTKAPLVTYGAQLTLNKSAGTGIVDPWREAVSEDTVPPQEFSIFLERDPLAFSGKYYISFNTTDKQTGIDQYQVMEQPIGEFGTFSWAGTDAPWRITRSPYTLEDQSLNSVIRVKAIDKAGNEYVATLLPDESLRTLSSNRITSLAIYGVIGIIFLCCLAIIFSVFIKRLRKKDPEDLEDREDESSDEDENTNEYDNEN